MQSEIKKNKFEEIIKRTSAMFIEIEAGTNPLISVTKTLADDKLKKIDIFVSVLPEDKEEYALNFLRRKRQEFREYLRKKINSRMIPHVDFFIDKGDKNRIKIEELSK